MDAVLDLLASPDDGLVYALLIASGLALVAVGVGNLLRGRSAVRRRASIKVVAEAAAGVGRGGRQDQRREAQLSLEHLMTYLDTTFAGTAGAGQKVLRRRLTQAGFFDQRAVAVFMAVRLAAGLLTFAAAFLALPFIMGEKTLVSQLLWSGGLGAVGYLAPSFLLDKRIAGRAKAHRKGFPDFMDLMVVCAEAGLSMEAAIDRIARELVEGYPSLAENLYMVSLEIRAGKSFGEALERLGDRLGIEEAQMLATLLQQSAELGTSLSQSLRVYSDEMRNKRMSRAEEKGYALPAKLVVPLILFVFPVLIMTLMLPVVVKVSALMGS